jgi:hypothetical protein
LGLAEGTLGSSRINLAAFFLDFFAIFGKNTQFSIFWRIVDCCGEQWDMGLSKNFVKDFFKYKKGF